MTGLTVAEPHRAGPAQGEVRSRSGANKNPSHGAELQQTQNTDLANLDLLRSVAVGLVFFTHLFGAMKISGLGDLGHFGVLLFFVHTALVLMLSMERIGLTGASLCASFMVRRIFRIYPLSILTVALVATLHIPFAPWFSGAMGQFTWPGWPALVSNLLLTQNLSGSPSILCVLWSLPFEVQMYVLLPVFYLVLRRFPSVRTALLLWLCGVSLAAAEYFARGTDTDSLLLRYFPCFLAGVIAWQLIAISERKLPATLWIVLLAILAVLYRLENFLQVFGPNWQLMLHPSLRISQESFNRAPWLPTSSNLLRDWVFCIITGMAVPFFAEIQNHWLNAITKRIAKYSYGIYLAHVPMLWVSFCLLPLNNTVLRGVCAVVSTALVSVALYHLIEHPAIQLGKRLSLHIVPGAAIA